MKRLNITLSDKVLSILDVLMEQDFSENRSAYLSQLVAQEYKERNKSKGGRPSKKDIVDDESEPEEVEEDYTDDTPKNIPYFGEMIGAREYAARMALQEQFKPK